MMHASGLFTLARDLAHVKVLSVYIDSRVVDPAKMVKPYVAAAS